MPETFEEKAVFTHVMYGKFAIYLIAFTFVIKSL